MPQKGKFQLWNEGTPAWKKVVYLAVIGIAVLMVAMFIKSLHDATEKDKKMVDDAVKAAGGGR
jgi:hypothetical protein